MYKRLPKQIENNFSWLLFYRGQNGVKTHPNHRAADKLQKEVDNQLNKIKQNPNIR